METNHNTDKQIREHYLLEKKLAKRILNSSPENRGHVTAEAYDTLYSSIPWHPRLNDSLEIEQDKIRNKLLFFEHLLKPNQDILEIGAGTGYFIRYLAHRTQGRCVGVDISRETLIKHPEDPPNLELLNMDAVNLNFPSNMFDLAISSQLVEHLHPNDTEEHINSVFNILKKNGVYAFDTPNRLTGPHDVSRFFDEVATGFHLKEWTYRELVSPLKKVGFRNIRTLILPRSLVKTFPSLHSLGTVPVGLLVPFETMVEKINHRQLRIQLSKLFRVGFIFIAAQK